MSIIDEQCVEDPNILHKQLMRLTLSDIATDIYKMSTQRKLILQDILVSLVNYLEKKIGRTKE